MTERLVLVLPEDRDLVSGGNLYNARLLAALATARPSTEAVGVEAARGQLAAGGAGDWLVDSVLREDAARLAAQVRPGQRVWLLVHFLPSLDPAGSAAVAARERELLAPLHGFVATSHWAAARLEPVAGSRPIVVVPPALVVEPRGKEPAGEGFAALLAGSLIASKGVLALLEALSAAMPLRWTLDVYGRGDFEPDYAAACRRAARQPGLAEHVRLHEPVPPEAMVEVYERSSVLVSASRIETYGMALAEARAFGLPVLALAGGNAAAHVRTEGDGKLFESVTHLVAACAMLARHPEALASLRRAAWITRRRTDSSWADAAQRLLTGLAGDAAQRASCP